MRGSESDKVKATRSSGDVFADIGLTLSAEDRLKIEIARTITAVATKGQLTQEQIATIIGADQAKVSNIMRGRLKGFSLERLFRYLLQLGYSVDLHVKGPAVAGQPGKVHLRYDEDSLDQVAFG